MKKFIYLSFFAMMLSACTMSPESKAEALIKDYVKKMLYNPDSYEVIETKVDSAFSPVGDIVFLEDMSNLSNIDAEYEKWQIKSNHADSIIAIFKAGNNSKLSKDQYQQAQRDFKEADLKCKSLLDEKTQLLNKICDMVMQSPEFASYTATQTFKAKNNSGQTETETMVFFIDKEFNVVMLSCTLDEYKQVIEGVSQMQEALAAQNVQQTQQ